MKTIPLTQGKIALVDDEDYERVMSLGPWAAVNKDGQWYAYANRRPGTLKMHRVIMDPPADRDVDHEDRDGLNNVRSNLRVATRTQNNGNAGVRNDNTSGFKGVVRDNSRGCWKAQIGVKGKARFIGRFADPAEAAMAYDVAALAYFGEFALTNEAMGLYEGVSNGRR